METTNIYKTAILMLKKDIKEKVELQKYYKNQRKTVHKDCSRKFGDLPDISPSDAAWKHMCNREELRRMYLAYGILRNRDLDTIDRNHGDIGGYQNIAIEYEKKYVKTEVEKAE